MNDTDIISMIRELADRKEILDCVHRYTRGVDRLDRELLVSAYHPDAIDDHAVAVEVGEAFADWVIEYHSKNQTITQHYVMNHNVELDGDVAHGETYYIFIGVNAGTDSPLSVRGGRYIDRFEKRDGRWAIAARVCIPSWRTEVPRVGAPPDWQSLLDAGPRDIRDKSDLSYHRPLSTRSPGTVPPPPRTPSWMTPTR